VTPKTSVKSANQSTVFCWQRKKDEKIREKAKQQNITFSQ